MDIFEDEEIDKVNFEKIYKIRTAFEKDALLPKQPHQK
jgi:hypothetical protein